MLYYSIPELSCTHNKELVLRVLSKEKSFYLRCKSITERDEWFEDLSKYIQ